MSDSSDDTDRLHDLHFKARFKELPDQKILGGFHQICVSREVPVLLNRNFMSIERF